jgi:hypothetical protein
MHEEVHLQPVQAPDIMRSAAVLTIATLIGRLVHTAGHGTGTAGGQAPAWAGRLR